MKGAFIPEAPHVQFEGFDLHTVDIGNILKLQRGEIRLTVFRSQTRKLKNVETEGIIPRWQGVRKQFQFPTGLGRHNFTPENKNWMGTLLISEHRFNLCD